MLTGYPLSSPENLIVFRISDFNFFFFTFNFEEFKMYYLIDIKSCVFTEVDQISSIDLPKRLIIIFYYGET